LEGPSTVKEHVIVYEERKECLTPPSASATKTVRGVRSTGHVYNLWPATTVSARVVAVNGNYEGLPSATVTFRTKEGGRSTKHTHMAYFLYDSAAYQVSRRRKKFNVNRKIRKIVDICTSAIRSL